MSTSSLRRVLVLTAAVCAVCVAVLPPAPVAQDSPVTAIPTEIPAEARNRANPRPATPESIEAGAGIFASQCAMCHGTRGDGQGELAARLKYTMPDFTAPEARARRTEGELFWILTEGHGKMKGEGDRLSDTVKWDLVNFVRSLARPS